MMMELSEPLARLDLIGFVTGAALLLLGRKLYWLVLAAVGFLVGLSLASAALTTAAQEVQLGVALLVAIVGAVFAIAAQKIALPIGGLLVGGFAAWWLAAPWQSQLGPWIWLPVIIAAAVGMNLASWVFDLALILLSSMVGSLMICDSLHLTTVTRSWTFLILFIIGILLQSSRHRRRRALTT